MALTPKLILGAAPPPPPDPAAARAEYARLVAAGASDADAWFRAANALGLSRQWPEAIEAFRRVIALRPDDVAGYQKLANVYAALGRRAEAEATYQAVLARNPRHAPAHFNLGLLALRHGDDVAAEGHFRAALALNPDEAGYWQQLSAALERQGRYVAAADAMARAGELKPDDPAITFMLTPLELRAGLWARGWITYDRMQRPFWNGERPLPQRKWNGEPLANRSILLTVDQGLGEQIMYASMLPDLLAQGARVVLECEPRLVPLLSRSFPGILCVPFQQPDHPAVADPTIDWRSVFGSIGRWLRPGFESFPRHGGYLIPDPARTASLRARYRALAGGKAIVGLAWHSSAVTMGAAKSLPFAALAPLLAHDDLYFVNAQYGEARRQADPARLHTDADVDPTGDIDAAAAQIAAVDRVLTVSSLTAHLGGALGKPTVVMLAKHVGRHWFWFPERDPNPWYPSVRALVQDVQGRWDDVVAAAGRALRPGG